ncbi:MAG: divergent polysaccharide deacetylase family protein [Pseudomonadota bacterium]
MFWLSVLRSLSGFFIRFIDNNPKRFRALPRASSVVLGCLLLAEHAPADDGVEALAGSLTTGSLGQSLPQDLNQESAQQAPRVRLAVVMDDLGYRLDLDSRIINWPHPVTVAVLPGSPSGRAIAEAAADRGKEVILHQPMQPHGARLRREPGDLRLDMDHWEFSRTLSSNLASVPERVGVNNHTGSALTEDPRAMHRLMQHLSEAGLYFLDSRTTPNTVAHTIAEEWGVPVVSRDVFLDHDRSRAAVEREFNRALGIARRDGHAVLIAHPNALSVNYLEVALRALPDDVELVRVSDLL